MSLIDALCTQRAVIRPYLRYAGGKTVYGEPETRACRLEPGPKTKVVYKNTDGSIVETVASALMFCPNPPIPIGSEVTCSGRTMRVIQCDQMRGFAPNHLEVLLE